MVASAAASYKPYVWNDLNTGKFHMINNVTGEKVQCTPDGVPLRKFIPGVSGVVRTKERAKLVAKDTSWSSFIHDFSLAPPARPAPFSDEEARSERTATKGRFGVKQKTEPDLFLREMARQRIMYPERVVLAEAAEAAARQKLEEAHKNHAALAASTDPMKMAEAAREKLANKREFKCGSDPTRFTSNMIYRP
eukprot:scaffold4029_cov117-Isochrysis_galbana.AAC.3